MNGGMSEQVTVTPEPLCASADIAERGKGWIWDVLEYGRPARAFALRIDGAVVAYMNRCLHVPTEMDWQPGEFLDMDRRYILCSVHGATYEPKGGRCIGGPCGRGKLTSIAVQEDAGQVYWYPSRDIRPVPFDDPAPVPTPAPAPGTTGEESPA
jgi:nitrite reductase/ring-hydroxylating ferredoxin subunit